LHLRVAFQPLLAEQALQTVNDRLLIPNLAEDFCRGIRMKLGERRAPLQIPTAIHGKMAAGNRPAADMLAAGGQAQHLGSIWGKALEPGGHALGVKELLGMRDPIDNLPIGVLSVGCVEATNSAIETFSISRHRQRPLSTDDELL
jgi:hypothetical protein